MEKFTDNKRARYESAMLRKPSYESCIHFRINFWKSCLELAATNNLFEKKLDDPTVSTIVKSLKIVHGAYEQYDDLFASQLMGKTRMHKQLDPDEKKQYVFFRIEQVPTPTLDPIATRLFNDFVKYGTSEYYGPYVYTSPFQSILDQEGKIAPIDNLKNASHDEKTGRVSNEELGYQFLLARTSLFLERNQHLIAKIDNYYPEYAENIRKRDQKMIVYASAAFRSATYKQSPSTAPINLKDFSKFFKEYPMLALLVFPPPFAEVMIKDRFRTQNIEYRPIEKARSISDYPEDYKKLLLGVGMGNDIF